MVAQSVNRLAKSPGLLAGLLFLISSLLYHLPAVAAARVPTQDDLEIFYFPLTVVTAEALREGHLPLWTPLIFGGYPLFADGEGGMLYPFHLLVLPWMPPETALVFLWILHSWLAAVFTYILMRVLGVGAFGAAVGALSYAYSGFAAGQSIHLSVVRGMVWLPLELALAERMCRGPGPVRYRYAVLTGAIFGMQALALHIHITLLSALAVVAFVLYRGLAGASTPSRKFVTPALMGTPPPPSPSPVEGEGTQPPPPLRSAAALRRGLRRAEGRVGEGGHGLLRSWTAALRRFRPLGSLGLALALVGAVGVGLSAVQLLPLRELAEHNYRLAGVPAPVAAANSLWPGTLLTLLLPRLHDTPSGDFWGPWVKWETTVYVGVLPLALAALGLFLGSGPYRPFFGGLMVGALLLALGSNGPIPLWDALHQLPGLRGLQSPGRFSLLFSLGVAVAAGYGAHWLIHAGPARRWALAILLAGGGTVLVGGGVLELARARLHTWAATGSWLLERYLELSGVPSTVDGGPLTMYRLAALLADTLSPGYWATGWQLILALGAVLVVSLAFMGLRRRAAVLALGLIFADLWVVGLTFHPHGPIGDLRSQVPRVLADAREGSSRVFTPPTGQERVSQVDANRLMVAGIHEAAGYASLQMDRHASYLSAVQDGHEDLLDLWNVRHVVRPNRSEVLPSYKGLGFHPRRPLFWGKLGDPGPTATFLPEGGPARADEIWVVAALLEADTLEEGEEVARIVAESAEGERHILQLQAGRDVSDTTIDVPGLGVGFAHGRAEVAFDHQRSDPDGPYFGELLFYSRLPLGRPTVLERLVLEHTAPKGRLLVYALGAFDASTGQVTQVGSRPDRRVVYRDRQIVVHENLDPLPRAFLMGGVAIAPEGGDVLVWMRNGPFDPRRIAIVEEPVPDELLLSEAREPNPGPVGSATIERYRNEEVVVRTAAEVRTLLVLADSFFPGWVATVDGQQAPLLQVNYLFRGVPVPAGAHTVTFSYRPQSLALGLVVSLLTAAALVALGAWQARRWLA